MMQMYLTRNSPVNSMNFTKKCIPKKKNVFLKKRVQSNKKIKPRSPWISFALLNSIRRKTFLYKKSIKKSTTNNIEIYKNIETD